MESLPLASPYPWTDSETQASRFLTKKRKGSGLSYLQNKFLSKRAKRIVDSLLSGHSHPEIQDTDNLQTSVFYDNKMSVIPQVAPEDASDATIMSMAQDGTLSLLLSILKQVDDGEQAVLAKNVIRNCALVVNPSTTPGKLDAKDMVLAALTLLSSDVTLDDASSSSSITLPLIEAENPTDDPEKRLYRKVGDWSSWTDYQVAELSELEVIVFSSNPMTRERFVPRHLPEELQLLQKGIVPPGALPKRKGPAPGYRRKSATTPSPVPP